jgi:hypothetical protein
MPNGLILSEISNQTIFQVFITSLAKDAKSKTFITYNFHLAHYSLANANHARQTTSAMLEYRFPQGQFRIHDPFGLV